MLISEYIFQDILQNIKIMKPLLRIKLLSDLNSTKTKSQIKHELTTGMTYLYHGACIETMNCLIVF